MVERRDPAQTGARRRRGRRRRLRPIAGAGGRLSARVGGVRATVPVARAGDDCDSRRAAATRLNDAAIQQRSSHPDSACRPASGCHAPGVDQSACLLCQPSGERSPVTPLVARDSAALVVQRDGSDSVFDRLPLPAEWCGAGTACNKIPRSLSRTGMERVSDSENSGNVYYACRVLSDL